MARFVTAASSRSRLASQRRLGWEMDGPAINTSLLSRSTPGAGQGAGVFQFRERLEATRKSVKLPIDARLDLRLQDNHYLDQVCNRPLFVRSLFVGGWPRAASSSGCATRKSKVLRLVYDPRHEQQTTDRACA